MMKRICAALLLTVLLCTTAFAAPFTDVTGEDWYSAQVEYVYEQGLMDGTSDTAFSPDMTLSRGMMLTILYRMAGKPAVVGVNFTDVEFGKWYSDAALWAKQMGIAEGSGDGTLGHADPLTREQMAVMLYRYARQQGYPLRPAAGLDGFADADRVSSWAKDAVAWAVSSGLLQGADGKLNPGAYADRAQVAVVIARFHQTWERVEENAVPVVTPKAGYVFYLADPVAEGVIDGDDLIRAVLDGEVVTLRTVPGMVSTMTAGHFYRVETTAGLAARTVTEIPLADVDHRADGVLKVDGEYVTLADNCVIYAISAATGAVRVIGEKDIADEDTGIVVSRNERGYATVVYVVDADG